MKALFKLIALVAIFFLSGCTHSVYWVQRRNMGYEKYNYARVGWPRNYQCVGMYPKNPVKVSTMRRYYFLPKHKKQ